VRGKAAVIHHSLKSPACSCVWITLPALVGDRDRAGIENVRRVSAALCKHKIDHVVINWNGFPNFHGKDLFDLLKSLNGQTPPFFTDFFSFPSLLQCSLSSLFSPAPSSVRGQGSETESCSSWRERRSNLKMPIKEN
jgi:hypothetical protein